MPCPLSRDQPTHAQQIPETRPQTVVDTIFGLTSEAWPVIDWDFIKAPTCSSRQIGDETLHTMEKRQGRHHFPAYDLGGASGIPPRISYDHTPGPITDARTHTTDEMVMAYAAVTHYYGSIICGSELMLS